MKPGPQFNKQLYHGSGQDITKVLPNKEHGVVSFVGAGKGTEQDASEHAFATSNEHDAWYFAQRAHSSFTQRDETGAPVRPRVYTVEKHPDTELGIRNAEHPQGPPPSRFGLNNVDKEEYRAPHFNVTGRIDIMPGRQGTFPINWNQFGKSNFNGPYAHGDLNHPDSLEEELGHHAGSLRKHITEVNTAHGEALDYKAPVNKKQLKLF